MNWIEKYRPKSLNNISSQKHVVESLKNSLTSNNVPHLLFYGPSGCGKTSTILALARDLFKEDFSKRVIELNASDERGINVIRDKIKLHANKNITYSKSKPSFKLIILDEADIITNESQFALRRIIEETSDVTRFCIICNNIHKIIDPIISRCTKFRFLSLENDIIVKRLNYICEQEKLKCNNETLKLITTTAEGDLRISINILQRLYHVYGSTIKKEDVIKMYHVFSNEMFDKLYVNIKKSKSIDEIIVLTKDIINNGYDINDILKLFVNKIVNDKYDNVTKEKFLILISDITFNLNNGCDEEIQLLSLFSNIYNKEINN